MVTTLSQDVAALAYELWLARGCPLDSPEEDWFRAEQKLQQVDPDDLDEDDDDWASEGYEEARQHQAA